MSAVSPLCSLAHWFPARAGHELEGARRDAHQWRETTWTDKLLRELKALRDPRILVKPSNERVTAADMDWWFVRADGSAHIRLTVQAKILHYLAVNVSNWAYPELRHPPGNHGQQARRLRRYASSETKKGRATHPLYIFYNPESVCGTHHGYWPRCDGATLADGYHVTAHLERHRLGKVIPITATRFNSIAPLMFGLDWLFCQGGLVPTPEEISRRLLDAQRFAHRTEAIPARARLRVPAVGGGVPRDIARLIDLLRDGATDTHDGSAAHPNIVVFIADARDGGGRR